jgi:hypothetical protein
LTARVNPALPAVADAGEIDVNTGTIGGGHGKLIVCGFEVPPPGARLRTVTTAVPAISMSAAGIVAVNCVPDLYVVTRSEPFQRTTEPLMKLVPFTVSIKPAVPAVTVVGEIDVVAGTGAMVVNCCGFEIPPPGAGLKTVTAAVPADSKLTAARVAVNLVGET